MRRGLKALALVRFDLAAAGISETPERAASFARAKAIAEDPDNPPWKVKG